MSKKKRYSIIFYLSENTWNMSGIPCPDCVDESNYQAWSRYLSKQIDKLLCAETMQTAEFQDAENGGYPPTQNGDIRSLFWLFSLMALQN